MGERQMAINTRPGDEDVDWDAGYGDAVEVAFNTDPRQVFDPFLQVPGPVGTP